MCGIEAYSTTVIPKETAMEQGQRPVLGPTIPLTEHSGPENESLTPPLIFQCATIPDLISAAGNSASHTGLNRPKVAKSDCRGLPEAWFEWIVRSRSFSAVDRWCGHTEPQTSLFEP